MDVKRGSRVICIGEFKDERIHPEKRPVKGVVYTVRSIIIKSGAVGLLLEEIVNPLRDYRDGFEECAFCIENFIPDKYQPASSEILARYPLTEEKADVQVRKIDINSSDKQTNK